MKTIQNISGRIFALWALVTFVATFLIFYIPAMISWLIPGAKGQHFFIIVSRVWMSIWLPLAGCPLRVQGKNNFKKGKTYIVVFNHNSLMDVPISCPFVPGPNKTIAKTSFAKIPLFGFFYMKGSVLVDRKSEESRRRSYEKMKTVLRQGMHMCIYPEGTRNRTDEPLKKFHDGAFRLAVDTGTPIIPAIIFNTKKVLPANQSFYFRPSKLKMHFLEPVEVSQLSADALKQKIFKLMQEHYVAHQ